MEENHGNSYQVPDQGIRIYGLNKRERREKSADRLKKKALLSVVRIWVFLQALLISFRH